jgi:hypothetical protein
MFQVLKLFLNFAEGRKNFIGRYGQYQKHFVWIPAVAWLSPE